MEPSCLAARQGSPGPSGVSDPRRVLLVTLVQMRQMDHSNRSFCESCISGLTLSILSGYYSPENKCVGPPGS